MLLSLSKINNPLRSFTKLSLILFVITAFSVTADSVFAQSSVLDSAFKDEKKIKEKSKKTTTPAPRKTTAPKKKAPSRATTPRKRSAKRVSISKTKPKQRQKLLDVTITSEKPFTQIWINQDRNNLDSAQTSFSVKLKPDYYWVTALKNDIIVYSRTKFLVNEKNTRINLGDVNIPDLSQDGNKENIGTDAIDQVTNKSTEENPTSRVNQILDDFMTPQTTDSITQSDWDFVYEASKNGTIDGNTAVQNEAIRWFSSGQIELFKGNNQGAVTAFSKSFEFMPNAAILYYAIGNAYLANNQPLDASKAYQKALQIDKKLSMVYKKIGDANRLLGKEKEAIGSYKAALSLNYNTYETHLWLGKMLIKTKQTEDGLQELAKAVVLKPTADVYIAIGEGYEKLKKNVTADEYYVKAIEYEPKSAKAFAKRGDFLLEQREFAKAKESLETALNLDPQGDLINRPEVEKKIREASSKLK